jgi:hypothetical protein
VDSVNRILVADHDGHEIWRFDPSGTVQGAYAIFDTTDYPSYMQFDASGNLYVVTADSMGTDNGKVWKIAPCSGLPCTASLLVDLGLAHTMGTIPNLASGGAIGITTPFVASAPQSITAGTPATFNFFDYSADFTFPVGADIPVGTTMRTTVAPVLPMDFSTTRLAGSAFADAQCVATAPSPDVRPNPCVVFRTECFDGGAPVSCPTTGTSAHILVNIATPPSPCTPIQGPALLEAHDDQNTWMNILIGATMSPADTNNLCTQTFTGATSALTSDFVVTQGAFALAGTTCDGGPGHQILPPIDADGSSVFRQGSTVPAKFRVCLLGDSNTSVGPRLAAPTVVAGFQLVQVIPGAPSGTADSVPSTTPDTAFRWDATSQQWIFNISTRQLTANNTYVFLITLSDGSTIPFRFAVK